MAAFGAPNTNKRLGYFQTLFVFEKFIERSTEENFDGESLPFVFIRRLLPLKLFRMIFANAFDDFYSGQK